MNNPHVTNIDWLEVFLLENLQFYPMDAEYFHTRGYRVESRPQGTPQYKEKFTIFDRDFPLYEISRNPYSIKKNGGIFEENACHLRLSNRACYYPDPIGKLRQFLVSYGYTLRGITRIDICRDFSLFDNGMKPQNMIKQYMNKGKGPAIRKINQTNITAHGHDQFDNFEWNSISWGSKTSMISTKMYNKLEELSRVGHDKFYIRDQWKERGIDEHKGVWRIEFSIKTDCKRYIRVADPEEVKHTEEHDGHVFITWDADLKEFIKKNGNITLGLPNELSTYDKKWKLDRIFCALSMHYFHFVKQTYLSNGSPQRKDRCPTINLIDCSRWDDYKPARVTNNKEPGRTEQYLINHLIQALHDKENNAYTKTEQEAALTIIQLLATQKRMKQYAADHGLTEEETKRILQGKDTLELKLENPHLSYKEQTAKTVEKLYKSYQYYLGELYKIKDWQKYLSSYKLMPF